jgi:hypothetical protein
MSIRFGRIAFQNRNSIEVTLTVEAPVGTRVISRKVAANSRAVVTVGKDDCRSVLLHVEDSAHHEATQTVSMETPKSSQGRPAYLESLKVEYTIGDFKGTVQSRFG